MTKHGKILFFVGTLDELNQKVFFKPSQYILAISIRLRLQAKKQTNKHKIFFFCIKSGDVFLFIYFMQITPYKALKATV